MSMAPVSPATERWLARNRTAAIVIVSLVGCGRVQAGPSAATDAGRPVTDPAAEGSRSTSDATVPSDAPGEAETEGGTIVEGGSDVAPGAACVPRTCQGLGLLCGVAPDGCGGALCCGDCPEASGCTCTPLTCAQIGSGACGVHSDGCGNVLGCGPCPAQTFADLCVPLTCADYGNACGRQSDGCGGLTSSCGPCPSNQFCGGGGPSRCGPVAAEVCAQLGSNCGSHLLCDNWVVDCGTCPADRYCGTNPNAPSAASSSATTCGGMPLDGGGGCVPLTCSALGYQCGTGNDGCGGSLHCGSCTPPATCGAGGGYNLCGTLRADGGPCLTCGDLPAACGSYTDGCGGLTLPCHVGSGCGVLIEDPATCGGGGIPFQCGSGGACKPLTCAQLGFECGSSGDGCGGYVDCGLCPPSETCGGGGFNRCGPGPQDAGQGG